VCKAHEGLADDGRGLQRVAGALLAHQHVSHRTELWVDVAESIRDGPQT
jgi:hypothetical protein